jgi:hypothetical protein
VVHIQLKKHLLDEGAAAKVATVQNFIIVVVRVRASEFGIWVTVESAISRLGLFRGRELYQENFMKQSKIGKGFSPNTYELDIHPR